MADPIIHLLHACEAGDLEAVKEMIERERVDVNATFYFDLHTHLELLDATPLLVSAGQGNLTICEYLICNGANVNYRTSIKSKSKQTSGVVFKFTPFHWAIKK